MLRQQDARLGDLQLEETHDLVISGPQRVVEGPGGYRGAIGEAYLGAGIVYKIGARRIAGKHETGGGLDLDLVQVVRGTRREGGAVVGGKVYNTAFTGSGLDPHAVGDLLARRGGTGASDCIKKFFVAVNQVIDNLAQGVFHGIGDLFGGGGQEEELGAAAIAPEFRADHAVGVAHDHTGAGEDVGPGAIDYRAGQPRVEAAGDVDFFL